MEKSISEGIKRVIKSASFQSWCNLWFICPFVSTAELIPHSVRVRQRFKGRLTCQSLTQLFSEVFYFTEEVLQ